MVNTYNNQNLLQDSVVFGSFVNCDVVSPDGALANARFKRNVIIGNDLYLGLEKSTTTNGVTAYTDTGGNIIVKKNGITYTLTPTILSHLSTISSNIQDQINNITTPDLSSYARKANPEFTGTALAPTPLTTDDSTKIATTAFVKAQGYLTTSPDLSSYALKDGPSFTGDVTIGQTSSDDLTINSKIYAKNGIVYPTLFYFAYTTEYNQFFGNFIMFLSFAPVSGTTQLLPSIPAGTNSSTIRFYNNTDVTLTLTRQNTSAIYGLLGNGLASISLLPKYFYELTSMYSGGNAYDNWLVTSAVNSQYQLVDIGTTQSIGGTKTFSTIPKYSGTDLDNTLNDGTLATTAFVKAQLSINSIYCELGGNYLPVDIVATPSLAGLTFIENTNDAIYSSVNAIVGYSSITMTSAGVGQGSRYFTFGNFRNYTTNGYDTSLYGFNTLNGNWKCPQTGKYSICINFYIKSNNGGNKFSLNKYNSSNTLIYSQYCLVGDTITTDTIRNFTTILPMNKDEYFKIVLTTYVGNTTMVFNNTNHTNMKIMLLAA